MVKFLNIGASYKETGHNKMYNSIKYKKFIDVVFSYDIKMGLDNQIPRALSWK
jgi:hypothetical protein